MRVQEAIATIQTRWRTTIVQRKVAKFNARKDTTEKQETLSSLNPDASMFISNNQLEEKLNVLEKTLMEDLKGIKRQLDKVVSQKTKYTSSRERLQAKKVQERDSKFLKHQFYRQKWFKEDQDKFLDPRFPNPKYFQNSRKNAQQSKSNKKIVCYYSP